MGDFQSGLSSAFHAVASFLANRDEIVEQHVILLWEVKTSLIIFEGLEFANPYKSPDSLLGFQHWLPAWLCLKSCLLNRLLPCLFLFLVTYTLGRNMKICYLAFLKRHSQLGWKDELRGSAILFDHLVSAWDLLQKKILREWGCKLSAITVTLFYAYVIFVLDLVSFIWYSHGDM